MKIIKPSIEVYTSLDEKYILRLIEKIGRTCYKSEDKITNFSCVKFIEKIIMLGHHAIIEHYNISVKVVCDRGVTHEIVRHRIASYAQESTRYCNYSSNKFGNEITVIEPCFWRISNLAVDEKMKIWKIAMSNAETVYLRLIELGATPQEARSVLPNSLKTEIVMTMNLREWRHFLTLRTSKAAHPQMREVANMVLTEFKSKLPVIFGDISNEN